MSRLVYQTATLLEKHDSSWFDYILTLLGPYCAGIVKKMWIVEITL